jgi:hypothetical protein
MPPVHSLLDHLPQDNSLLDHLPQDHSLLDHLPQDNSLLYIEHMLLYYSPPPISLAAMLLAAQTLAVGSYDAIPLGNHVRARQGGEYMSGVFTGYEFSPEHGDVSCFWRCQCQKEHNCG